MQSNFVSLQCCIAVNRCLVVLGVLSFPLADASSQVINDDIESRMELHLNTQTASNTTNCTLQWECINKQLTRKCIQYHNDQWFFFKASRNKKLFLNVSKQGCRDMRGIQVLVIEGKACEPESHIIKKCVSLGNHDDVFIQLDSLELQKEYLVQIDGYLNDFCAFEIEICDRPKGMPLNIIGDVDTKAKLQEKSMVNLSWNVSDSLANLVERYEVWRLFESDFKSTLITEISQDRNAYGNAKLNYSIDDVLPKFGSYNYKIIAVGGRDRTLVSTASIFNKKPKNESEEDRHWLRLDLYYPYNCKVSISIFDAKRQQLLNYCNFNYSFDNQTFETYIKDYIDEGITDYRMQVENLGNGEKQNFFIKK